MFQGPLDRLRRNLVEFDSVLAPGVQPQHVLQMPGNRLSLAVGVGGEIHFSRLLRLLGKAPDDVLLALRIDILGLEIVLDVHAQRMHGQIADMPRGSVYFVLSFEILCDGLCLGRRLYDDKIHMLL